MSYDTILAKSPYVIYQPGGVSAGLVVTTWTAVQAFIALRQGAVTIFVDDSITSPALVPAASGVTECFGRVTLDVYKGDSDAFTVLQIEDGATLRNLARINVLEVRCDCKSATPSLDWPTALNGGLLFITGFGKLSNSFSATNPAIVITGGKNLYLYITSGFLSLHTSSVPLINMAAGSTLEMSVYDGSVIDANFVAGGGDVQFTYDNATASFFASPGVAPPLPSLTGSYSPVNLDNIWVNKPLDPASMGSPAVGNVPTFNIDGTWHAQTPVAVPPVTHPVVNVNWTVSETTGDVYLGVSGLTADITITLPSGGMEAGSEVTIKDEDASLTGFSITVDGNGLNIDGAATFVMNLANVGAKGSRTLLQTSNAPKTWSVV